MIYATGRFTVNCLDLGCDFDGSTSSDPDGNIVSYAWLFGDGVTSAGDLVAHDYADAGGYLVTLTVTDDGGATHSTSQTVTVTAPADNQPPSASFTFSCTDLTCDFDGTASSDPEGGAITYTWDLLGDGSTIGNTQTVSHTYATAGTYTVILTVTDDAGATATATQNVTVSIADTAGVVIDSLASWLLDGTNTLISSTSVFNQGDRIGILSLVDADPSDITVAIEGATVTLEIRDSGGTQVATLVSTSDAGGDALGVWQTEAPRGRGRFATAGTPIGTYTAEVVDVVKDGYTLDLNLSVTTVTFEIQ